MLNGLWMIGMKSMHYFCKINVKKYLNIAYNRKMILNYMQYSNTLFLRGYKIFNQLFFYCAVYHMIGLSKFFLFFVLI